MEKDKALEAALSQIERAFGKGSIMRLGQQGNAVEIPAISTDVPTSFQRAECSAGCEAPKRRELRLLHAFRAAACG